METEAAPKGATSSPGMAAEATSSVAEETKPPAVAEEAKPPVVEEAHPPAVVEETKPPVVEETKPPAVAEESKPPVVEEAKPPAVVEEVKPPVAEETKPPAVAEEAKPPVVDETKPPAVVENAKPPSVEKKAPPTLEVTPPTRAELARETFVPPTVPPLRQIAVLGSDPRGMMLIGTNGGTLGSMREMLQKDDAASEVITTQGRARGPVKQRYKAFIQTTVYKDNEPRAAITPLFTPAQMKQEVANFRPVPILIDHEKHQPSIGTLEKIWIEPFDGNPSLCGQLYFHMQNEDSRRVVDWLQTKGGADLSLGCDHGYDRSHTKRGTLIHEISVVAMGNYDGAFVRTNASALKINSDSCLTLPLSCYIELGTTIYTTMASNEMITEAAPSTPAAVQPAETAAPPTQMTISPEIALRVYKQDSALAEESRRIGTPQVKNFADLHEQACADPSKLADTAFIEQYTRTRDIADAVVAAMAEAKRIAAPAEAPAKRPREAMTPQELEIEMDKRRRASIVERLREAPTQWKAKTGALDMPPGEMLPYDVPANFEEWKKAKLSGNEYEPKVVRFATEDEAKAYLSKILKGDTGNGYTFKETRVQTAAGAPAFSFRQILKMFES